MIQKKFFPQQDTPRRVKNDIINKLHQTPKKVRLMYMFRYKLIIPALLFMAILSIGYLNIYAPHTTLIAKTPESKETLTTIQNTISKSNTTTNEIALQEEISKAETALNQLSDTLYKEDISL